MYNDQRENMYPWVMREDIVVFYLPYLTKSNVKLHVNCFPNPAPSDWWLGLRLITSGQMITVLQWAGAQNNFSYYLMDNIEALGHMSRDYIMVFRLRRFFHSNFVTRMFTHTFEGSNT